MYMSYHKIRYIILCLLTLGIYALFYRKLIYLAGAMEKRYDGGARWRNIQEPLLIAKGYRVFNPVTAEDTTILQKYDLTQAEFRSMDRQSELFETIADEIWKKDMEQIRKSDLIIAYLDEAVFQSSGTLCELSHARDYNIETHIVRRVPLDKIPLWTRACCGNIYSSFKKLQEVV